MKNNSVLFNSLSFKRQIETLIKDSFDKDENKPEKFWYNAFGKRKIKCYTSFVLKANQFPCFFVSVTATPDLIHAHSTQLNQYSKVLLEIQVYNKATEETEMEVLGAEINYRIQEVLQEELGLPLITDMPLFNPDESIYRHILRYSFIYDNINKIIFRGE